MSSRIKVNGLAIKPGVSRNGIMYSKEELKKFSPTLEGVSIIKDHEAICDNAIGKVEKVTFNESTGFVEYQGWIENDSSNIIEKIKDGRISHVSIGALAGKMVKEKEDSEYITAKDLIALELSTVISPGVPGASIQQNKIKNTINKEQMGDYTCPRCGEKFKDELMEAEHDMVTCPECGYEMKMKKEENNQKSNSNESENNNEKEVNMESEEKKEKVDTNAVIAQENAMLKKQIADMNEANRQEAIVSYSKIVESKGLKAIDVTNATMDTIKAVTEMAEGFEVVKAVANESKKAETKTNVTKESNIDFEEQFKGYVIEKGDRGFAFYKSY